MLASIRSRFKSWVVFAVAAWMVAGNPSLRRQVLGFASTATRAVWIRSGEWGSERFAKPFQCPGTQRSRAVAIRTRGRANSHNFGTNSPQQWDVGYCQTPCQGERQPQFKSPGV